MMDRAVERKEGHQRRKESRGHTELEVIRRDGSRR